MLTACSIAAVTSAPAFAQDTAAPATSAQTGAAQVSPTTTDTGSAIQEIVVTAQFRAQNVQDTPIAITAVDAATLNARSQTSITDIGDFAPNVALEPATGLQGNSIAAFIRGIGQLDASFALEPGVGVYIDDIYYGTTFGASMDLTDLDRVEVLRGPQGTLSGKNSVGGSVKLFSKRPTGSGKGFLEATYGRFDRLDFRGSFDLALSKDLFARVSAVSKSSDGYMKRLDYGCVNPSSGIPQADGNDDCVIGTEGGRDYKGVRVALRYAPEGSPLEVNLVGDYSKDDSQIAPSKLLYAANPAVRSYVAANPVGGIPFDGRFITGPKSYTSYATYGTGGNYTTVFGIPVQIAPGGFSTPPKSTAESWGVANTIELDLSDALSLTSITGYRRAQGTAGIDVDGSPLAILLQEFTFTHKQFTQEVRLSGKFGDGLIDTTVGGFYYDARDRLDGRNQIPTLLFDFLSDDRVKNRSVSAFGHLEVHLTDKLNLIGGLRYTDDKKQYNYGRRNIDGTVPSGVFFTPNFLLAGLDGLSGTFKGDRVDYRVGANYAPTSDLLLYAQVSTGFKGGGINPRPSAPDQVRTFGPEKLTTYEAGFKSDLFDRHVRINGAVFRNDYDGIQLVRYQCPDSVVLSCSVPSNAGDARIFGFELESTFIPVDGLQINAVLGYLDFDYRRITNPATLVTLDMIAPFVSKWQSSAGIQYVAEMGSGSTLTPRLDWSYRSDFYYNSVNTPFSKIEGYSTFNGRLTFDSANKDWQISAAVTNIFDKFYYTGVAENVGSFGVVTGNPGRPREWSISVRRSF
jgi:iron complex outermembrane receptor protein